MPHDRDYWIWKTDRGENVRSDTCVHLHLFEFRRCEWTGLVEYVLWDGELSHVMEQRCRFDRADLFSVSHTNGSLQTDRVSLKTSNMAMGNLILIVYCHCQRFDR